MIYRGGGEDAAGGIEMLTLKRVDVRPVVVPLKRPIVSLVGFFDAWPLILIDPRPRKPRGAPAEGRSVRKTVSFDKGPYPSSLSLSSSLRSRFRNSAHGKTTATMKPTRMPRRIKTVVIKD